MENIIIIGILVLVVAVAILHTVKHFRGKGGCCGGGSSYRPKRKKLPSKGFIFVDCFFNTTYFGLKNFWVGIFHGFVYGIIISCCGCYYGINCGRKAESVGLATTNAVVSAIVIMIVVTGILTLICQVLKI